MSQEADQLLDSVLDGEASSHLVDPTLEEHIIIGEDRFITVPQMLKRIAVQHDHDIETVTFDCPRYWDGIDMSTMKVYINYLNANSNRGMYHADDVTIDENDDTIMHFTWTISREVTLYQGTISFLVCIRNVDDDGYETNHWNSELNRDMTVSEGLECSESIIQAYPDIITQLLVRMDRIGVSLTFEDDGNGNVSISGVNNLNNFCEKYDERSVYYTGDYCMYLGVLYKCIYPVTEPELFDFNKWVETSVTDEILKCFQCVDDGKTLIAAAITDMEVPTAATDTFEQMATNIRSIETCPEGSTAEAEHVLSGKKFINSNRQLVTGTMLNHSIDTYSEVTLTPGQVYNIAKGYHDGKRSVKTGSMTDSTPGTAVAADILKGKTAWVNGAQITGAMVDRSGTAINTLQAGASVTLEPGYYNNNKITAAALNTQTAATAVAGDIRTGKTAWVNGAKLTGTLVPDATVLFDATEIYTRYVTGDDHNRSTSISYTAAVNGTIKIQARACMETHNRDTDGRHGISVNITKNSSALTASNVSITPFLNGGGFDNKGIYKRYEVVVDVVAGDVIKADFLYSYDTGTDKAFYTPVSSLTVLKIG